MARSRIIARVAVVLVATVLGTVAADAAAMRCSGEEKTCIAGCMTGPAAALRICITNCGQRRAMCLRTGCWDSGAQRYCGLLRQ